MTVVRLDLAYDGTDFHGWAAQPGVRTIEGELTEALERLLGSPSKLTVAGRTDAGVHATGQVASFVMPPQAQGGPRSNLERIHTALLGMLAPEIVVRSVRAAPVGFDARHSATGREYVYRIGTGRLPDPFTARFVLHRPGPLAIGRMREAARQLLGEHDFASFCRAPQPPGATTVRRLRRLAVSSWGDRVEVRAEANAFLHQMVRSLVGTLLAVGDGRMEPSAMPEVLSARQRQAAGPIAPARGLVLVHVRYR